MQEVGYGLYASDEWTPPQVVYDIYGASYAIRLGNLSSSLIETAYEGYARHIRGLCMSVVGPSVFLGCAPDSQPANLLPLNHRDTQQPRKYQPRPTSNGENIGDVEAAREARHNYNRRITPDEHEEPTPMDLRGNEGDNVPPYVGTFCFSASTVKTAELLVHAYIRSLITTGYSVLCSIQQFLGGSPLWAEG